MSYSQFNFNFILQKINQGGTMKASYEYTINNPGIANSTKYPYSGEQDQCNYNRSNLAEKAVNFEFIHGDEEFIKRALATIGPLAVAMKGDVNSFYYYGSGIYDDLACGSEGLNHAVCLVGEKYLDF